MTVQFMDLARGILALIAGGLIGALFGALQNRALQRNEKRQSESGAVGGLSSMSGSMRRTVYLILALVVIQLVCPLLFVNGTEWWVSAGVCLGYGSILFRRIRGTSPSL